MPRQRTGCRKRSSTLSLGEVRLSLVKGSATLHAIIEGHPADHSAWSVVPSNKRASEVEQYGEKAEASNMLEEGGDEEGWVAPPMQTQRYEAEEISSLQPAPEAHYSTPAEEEDDIPDIDELELEDHEADEVRSHFADHMLPRLAR